MWLSFLVLCVIGGSICADPDLGLAAIADTSDTSNLPTSIQMVAGVSQDSRRVLDQALAVIAAVLVLMAFTLTGNRTRVAKPAAMLSRLMLSVVHAPGTDFRDSGEALRFRYFDRGSIVLPGLACVAAGLIAFEAGRARTSDWLDRVDRDRRVAEGTAQQGERIVEALVSARREEIWGDEIELSSVRAVDGKGPVPEKLLLSLASPDAHTKEKKSIQTRMPSRAHRDLWPGGLLRLGLRIKPIQGRRNPGSADRESAAALRGFAAQARLVDPDWVVVQERSGLSGLIPFAYWSRLRSEWRYRVARGLERAGDRSGLMRALALGDRRGVSPEISNQFRKLGISHLLAVSGLHIGMLAGLVGWLSLRALSVVSPRCVDPFPFVLSMSVLGSAVYAAWVTGGVSVSRAWLGLMVLALFARIRRTLRPIELLSGIALALWVAAPAILFGLGAKLSFCACAGLIAGGVWRGSFDRGHKGDHAEHSLRGPNMFIDRVRSIVGTSLRVSSAAGFGTAYVLVESGLTTSWIGPLANTILVPWTALFVLPASLIGALLIAISTFLSDADIGAHVELGFMNLVLGLLSWPAECLAYVASWGGALVDTVAVRHSGSLVLCGVAAAAGLLALRTRAFKIAALFWVVVAFSSGPVRVDQGVFSSVPRVWFFDVGQGDAALVEGRRGTMLIDTGPGAPDGSGGGQLVRSLRFLGRTSLDLLVLTHADLDHRGGGLRVLESLTVAELWLPESGRGDPSLEELARTARRRGTEVRWRHAEPTSEWRGDLEIEVLWPPPDRRQRSRNAGSLVLRIGLGEEAFLFLADIDAGIERDLIRRDPNRVQADYLKVSHHGSRKGTPVELLEAVGARHAVVSAPCIPGRGLPSAETLQRIRASPTRLWWTGRDGAIAIFPFRHEERHEERHKGRNRRDPDGSEASTGEGREVLAWSKARRCPP